MVVWKLGRRQELEVTTRAALSFLCLPRSWTRHSPLLEKVTGAAIERVLVHLSSFNQGPERPLTLRESGEITPLKKSSAFSPAPSAEKPGTEPAGTAKVAAREAWRWAEPSSMMGWAVTPRGRGEPRCSLSLSSCRLDLEDDTVMTSVRQSGSLKRSLSGSRTDRKSSGTWEVAGPCWRQRGRGK